MTGQLAYATPFSEEHHCHSRRCKFAKNSKFIKRLNQGTPEMNPRSASTFALALITGFGSATARAQETAPARQTETNAAAMRIPNPSTLRAASNARTGSAMRPEAASFTEEQLSLITRLAPETTPQGRIIVTNNTGAVQAQAQAQIAAPTTAASSAPTLATPAMQAAAAAAAMPVHTDSPPVANVVVRSPQARYEITADDETLYLTLRRWTSEAGYQLVWSAGKDFPVKRTIYDAPDVTGAIAMAMKDTEYSAYPLHACTYTNNVIRVLHVSQSCVPK